MNKKLALNKGIQVKVARLVQLMMVCKFLNSCTNGIVKAHNKS